MKVLAKQIDVVASFRKNGVIIPRKFRITGNDEEHIIKIERIIETKETRLAGVKSIVFTCMSCFDDNIEKLFEIKYRIEEHCWELYKM